MAKFCCVSGCKSLPESEKFFHNFPVNFDLCMQWVQKLGDEALWQEFQYGGAYPFLHRSVCSDHFLDIDFKVFGDRNSGLRDDVIPSDETNKPDEALNPVQLQNVVLPDIEPVVVEPIVKIEENPDRLEPSKLHLLQKVEISEEDEDIESLETEIPDQSSHIISMKAEIVDNEISESELLTYPESEIKPEICEEASPAQKVEEKGRNESPEQRAIRLEKSRIYIAERRKAESEDETNLRRQKVAKHAAQIRTYETEEQRRERLEKARIRTAEKRKSMTQEEKALWREKNRIQTRERRQNEDEIAKVMRRYNNAVRASIKRSQESEEQRMERRYRDALRAARKRRSESSEERQARLLRDRERVAQKRMEIKMKESPEEKQARLLKGREQVYKRRHPIPKTIRETPDVLSILKSINEHLSQINQPVDSDNVASFVKASHPYLNGGYVNNVVESVLNGEDSNEFVELTDISRNNVSLESIEGEESYESSYNSDNVESPEVP